MQEVLDNDKDKIIESLVSENTLLRERLSHLEMMYAIGAVSIPSRAALYTPVEECECLDKALESVQLEHAANPERVESHAFPQRPQFEKVAEHPGTQVVVFDGCPGDSCRPSSMPIYQTATFVQPDISNFGPYDYTRSGNPTRASLEKLVAKLDGTQYAFAFTSGMAALQTLLTTLDAGDVVIAGSDLYGGTHRLMTQVSARLGIGVVFVDTWDLEAVRAKMTERVKLIHFESPTNPLMRVTDIRAICAIAHQHGVLVSMDNTMMSPVRSNPIALGCDYTIYSGTKFLCGHSDTMCGIICVKDATLAKQIAFLQNAQGNALSPFDSWLLLRSLKTLSIRVERQELNALAVALFLGRQTHVVKRLQYAGINPKNSPGVFAISEKDFEIHRSQTTGPGCVMSFETGDFLASCCFVRALKLFKLTVSFGSCNSLVELPSLLSHASITKEEQKFSADVIRLSIGIEHIEDILSDLSSAVDAAAKMF